MDFSEWWEKNKTGRILTRNEQDCRHAWNAALRASALACERQRTESDAAKSLGIVHNAACDYCERAIGRLEVEVQT